MTRLRAMRTHYPLYGTPCRHGVVLAWKILAFLWLFSVAQGGPAPPPPATASKEDRGFWYQRDQVPEIPWSISVFRIARSHREFEFCTTLGSGEAIGMANVSDQVKTLPAEAGQPIAAINGDFYDKSENYQGRPRDLQIRLGELISSPRQHTCFWVDPSGDPHLGEVTSGLRVIWQDGSTTPLGLNEERQTRTAVLYTAALGKSTRTPSGPELVLERSTNANWLPLKAGQTYLARVREVRRAGNSPLNRKYMVLSICPKLEPRLPKLEPGSLVRVVTETMPDLTGVRTAIGGGPALIRDGKPVNLAGVDLLRPRATISGIHIRHPRTAFGWNKDFFFLVLVDGRQNGFSLGMTLPELTEYMLKLGCQQAMNLDGGGSATLWAIGSVMNSPSEGQERPAANALVVVRNRNAKK